MSRQQSQKQTYTDPADERMMGSQSFQMVKSYFAMMVLIIGGMMFDLIMFFYANLTWGAIAGIGAGAGGAIVIGGGLWGYYDTQIRGPVSSNLNMSVQCFESPSKAYGFWAVSDQPLSEIPMSDEQRKLPARIPVGYFGRKSTSENQSQTSTTTDTGLTIHWVNDG